MVKDGTHDEKHVASIDENNEICCCCCCWR